MSEYKHIPSCKPNNKELQWHCTQCGLDEYAKEVEAELERYRQALEFYADLKNWKSEYVGGTLYTIFPIFDDSGAKARDALEEK